MKACGKVRRIWVGILVALGLCGGPAFAESVDFTAPGSVTILVTDASAGGTASTTLSFSSASITGGNKLRISIKAEASNFLIGSGGTQIPASYVTWTAGNASSGTGFGGTLSSSVYTRLFESAANPTSGNVDITWTLSAPGSGIRAGNHTLTLRWQLESVAP